MNIEYNFPLEEDNMPRKECTVADYLWKRYKIQLRYPFLPCIQFGDVTKHQYIPVELCTILPGQKTRKKLNDRQTAQMIKHAALPAYQRKKKIESWVEKRDYDNDPYLKHFGITVSKDMKRVDGRVLPSPKIKYSAGKRNIEPGLQPRNGSWDIGDFHYMKACSIKSWALVSFAERVEEGQLREIISRLENIMKGRGITMGKPSVEIIRRGMDDSCIKNIFYDMKKRMPDLEFVFVIMSHFQKGDYDLIKQVASIELGLITQCMQEKNVPKALDSSQFLRNICHKINSKLGGVNNSVIRLNSGVVTVFSKPVIIMGADVTHPAAGDSYRPSIAAVVGSLDSHPFKFMAEVRVQKHRQEYIEHLQEMTKSLLVQFYRETKAKPHKIIFYRDGVSEGQFLEILKNEVLAIRNACTSLDPNYKPGITFLIVQKRHQTRLFCEDERDAVGRAGNVPPGTCVDTDITHPFNYDYYLCSHEGIMGTSKPAHYFPLWDDNDFSPNELQALTNELCYVYANCTRSVSLPVPAYYAHKAAFLARSHLEKVFRNGDASCDKNGYPTSEMEDAIRVSDQLRSTMYFT